MKTTLDEDEEEDALGETTIHPKMKPTIILK
jgi:hypothetical protein